MRRRLAALLAVGLAAALWPAGAQAAFGLHGLDVTFTTADGSPAVQAGSHPFAMTTSLELNSTEGPEAGTIVPDGAVKDLLAEQVPGFVGDNTAVPRCSTADFLNIDREAVLPACPNSTAVGLTTVSFATVTGHEPKPHDYPVYNLVPPPGAVAKFGFVVIGGIPVTIEAKLTPEPPYDIIAPVDNVSQVGLFFGAKLTLWGVPGDQAHDPYRGSCLDTLDEVPGLVSKGECPTGLALRPFLTLPRACTGPLASTFTATSWQGGFFSESVLTHDASEPPVPQGFSGCGDLAFGPSITAKPTNSSAGSPTGLDFGLDVHDEGITNPSGIAASDIRAAEVVLPEGGAINPSQAEGLGVCSKEDLARESAGSAPGEGCPQASKIGTIEVETPLLEQTLKGALFVAKPHDNLAGNSLIAFYIVIKDPELGIVVKQAAKVTPDPKTGQLVTTTEEMPQLPFSHFRLHFREGGRSPLISPPLCGEYETKARLTPWANPVGRYETTSSFKVTSGPGGGPCPPGGTPPFSPGFEAGAVNNAAGAYSPFVMRLTRRDGDQDITRFSAKLPPGVVGRLAGTSECPQAAIEAAKAKTGLQEQANPSCPASSEIGHVIGGAGVGAELLYVPGKLYLAGPLNGAPLSVVSIVPAVAGPFDVGNVVTQEALRIDPRTAEVEADGTASDPLPHILAGIPLKVRDIRVFVDKPNFTLNPTSCDASATLARIWGGGADVFSAADDVPVDLQARYQAAGCQALGFGPKLGLKLSGGTRRGAFPKLRGTYTPRPGDANLAKLVLRLPHSAFLEQGHIRTICTRVQFAQKACPAGAVYGEATAYTPLLSEPLQGPVILRSSNHNLPDLVAVLHGIVDVEAVARIDSAHGGIRATFSEVPDAPLSKVLVSMQGGAKGLIVNSTNLCGAAHRADARFTAHNSKVAEASPPLRADCGRKSRGR